MTGNYIYKDMFTFSIELLKINTRHKLDLHVPSVNLTKVQKRIYYSGITLFNSLPLGIMKVAHNTNKFKHELKKFLIKTHFILLKIIWIEMLHMILVFSNN
jgi:hypothetical protein